MKTMLSSIARFSTKTKIPRPRDPTVSQSFETKISDGVIKMLIDPKGFMSEQERQFQVENNMNDNKVLVDQYKPAENKPQMEPEYGFKPKGLEPTRYGDWQIKGKCVDF